MSDEKLDIPEADLADLVAGARVVSASPLDKLIDDIFSVDKPAAE